MLVFPYLFQLLIKTDVLGLTQQGRWPDPGAIGTSGRVSDKSAVGVDLCVTLC